MRAGRLSFFCYNLLMAQEVGKKWSLKQSIVALAVGYVTVAILTMFTFAILFRNTPPEDPRDIPFIVLIFLFLAGVLYSAIGGAVCAWRARTAPIAHTTTLGVLMTLFGIISYLSQSGTEPAWFQIATVATPLPATLFGGVAYKIFAAR